MLYQKKDRLIKDFFIKHPVFTIDELKAFQALRGTVSKRLAEATLAYYMKTERLIRIKRSLYAVVPSGSKLKSFIPDLYLIASRMSEDSVIAYHTALELHGYSYTLTNRFIYQTAHACRPIIFRGNHFQPVKVSIPLVKKKQSDFGVEIIDRNGLDIKVTSLERTFVDLLDKPQWSGSWEEIWRSLESVEYFNIDIIIEYLKILDNATTTAKAGYFLEQHKDLLLIEDKYFMPLIKMIPQKPHYMDRKASGILVKKWNLIVPKNIIGRSWEEVL